MTNPFTDRLIGTFDAFVRTTFVTPSATRPTPRPIGPQTELTSNERRHSAGLMRVNHVGEICAQGLYAGQAVATRKADLRDGLLAAAREETDHLAWTASRLAELGARPSVLNPAWYAGSYALGFVAGKVGDAVSLGFVVETERQVEAHLASHLETLPANDAASRAIVEVMRRDEVAHGKHAEEAGAARLPPVVGLLMRATAKLMTVTAYRI